MSGKIKGERQRWVRTNGIYKEETPMARVEAKTKAPGFTAVEFNGNSVSLADFTGRKNVLLILNRSFT